MDLDLRLVRAFVTVADRASFSAAARDLHTSQPALSQQVRRLEQLLGVQLLERDTRNVTLSIVGGLFLDDARHLLAASERAVLWMRRTGGRTSGVVRVGFVPGTPSMLTTRLIRLAARQQPA